MKNLKDTIARLAALRRMQGEARQPGGTDRLQELTGFGTNPGALHARIHVPSAIGAGAPLVVVLHGCTQNAAGYDHGAGWSQLADEQGFALLFPEQQRSNNPNLCFNWFEPGDVKRGGGEALSIRQMIEAMVREHKLDPTHIFITGLSAGGAMAMAMLATYPELFAGGAIIAGLPYGAAASVPEAFERMRGEGGPSVAQLVERARAASPHNGRWPVLSVWHGSRDATVNRSNADAIVAQWRGLHGLGATPTRKDVVDGTPHQVWTDAKGRAVIEQYSITGMGHGTPLATTGGEALGASGPYMLEVGISSTRHIAQFWGLTKGAEARKQPAKAVTAPQKLVPIALPEPEPLWSGPAATEPPGGGRVQPHGVQKVIEDALRAAGLLR